MKDHSLSFASETENETFGKLILQTNEVQTKLACIVILHSSLPDKKYIEFIYETTLGKLISIFQVCTEKKPRDKYFFW